MDRPGLSHEPAANPRAKQCAGGTQCKNPPPNGHDSNVRTVRASQSQRRRRVDSTQGQLPGGNQGDDQDGEPPNNPNHHSTAPLYAQRWEYCCTYCDECKGHFSIDGDQAFCSNGYPALLVRVGQPEHPCLGRPLRAQSTSSGQWECPHSCLYCENCAHLHRRWDGQQWVRSLCSHDRYAVFVSADHSEHSHTCPGPRNAGYAQSAAQYVQNYPGTRPASSSSPARSQGHPSNQTNPFVQQNQSPSLLDQRGLQSLRNRSSSTCSQEQQQHQPQRSPTLPSFGRNYVRSSSPQH